jgi:hypothetical protein
VQELVLPQIRQIQMRPEHCVPLRKMIVPVWRDRSTPGHLRNGDSCSPAQQQPHAVSQFLSDGLHRDGDEYPQTSEAFAAAGSDIRYRMTFTLYEQVKSNGTPTDSHSKDSVLFYR